jgi:hypothetical protein
MGTISWAHGVSGHFNTAADWVGGVVPGGLDDAELTASGTYTVTSSQTNTVFGVALASGATLAVTNGTFTAADGTDGADNAGTISIGNNTVFVVGGASNSTIELKDSGIITLNSTGSPTTLVLTNSFGSQIIDLDGGGKLKLSGNGNNLITTDVLGTILENHDTISGSGRIRNLVFENSGLIDASGSKPLVILGTVVDSNSGTIESTSSGGLDFNGVTFDNSGTIKAATAGAVIDLDNSIIDNGTVSTVAGSSIVSLSNTVNSIEAVSVDNGGNIEIRESSTLVFGSSNIVQNSGIIALNAGGGLSSRLSLDGTVTLEGKGKLTLTDSSKNLIEGGLSAQLNNINNTIRGAGTIGDVNTALLNESVIDGTGKNPLVIAASASTVQNTGTIESSSTGGVEFLGVSVLNGSSGVVEASTVGSHIDLSSSEINGGKVKTAAGATIDTLPGGSGGEIADSLSFDNAGTLLVNDNSVLLLGSNVDNTGAIDVNGDDAPTFLEIENDVFLTGTGKVTLTGDAAIISNGLPAALVNVSNTISGNGTIGDSNITFDNDPKGLVDATGNENLEIEASTNNEGTMENSGTGALIFFNGGSMTNSGTIANTEAGVVTIADPIENNGTLRASAGNFDIGGALSGTGSLLISGSGEMNLVGNAGITQNVTFAAGATGTLEFQASATTTPTAIYDGVISGFGAADAIDLFGLSYVPGSSTVVSKVFSAGDTTLTVTNGTDTVALKFAGNLTGHTFVLGDDGSGKTRITDPVGKIASGATTTLASTANDSPSLINLAAASNVALLGNYMASMFASVGGQVGTPTVETSQNQMVLAHPHA